MIDMIINDKPILEAWEKMERSKENFFTNHAKREQELDEAINSLNKTLAEAEANRTKNADIPDDMKDYEGDISDDELMASLKNM